MANPIFKIDFTNRSLDQIQRTAYVQSATAAQARSRLLSYVADVQEVRRANAVELGEALASAISGEMNDRLVVLIGDEAEKTQSEPQVEPELSPEMETSPEPDQSSVDEPTPESNEWPVQLSDF